ncbi:hypothetical protein Rs2_47123 [Raphanus sativus]|nr:hypothetical protein Rs2_47123 [Raphanus sativus]
MSLILRFRQHLSNKLSPPLASLITTRRSFGQPARKQDEDEEEEVEIDQRKLPTDYDPATFDPTEHRSPPTDRVFRLVDEISSLTLSEISELGAIIMKKRGITEIPTVAVMNPELEAPSGSLRVKPVVVVVRVKKLKWRRLCLRSSLREAKELVEKTPSVLKAGVSKEEGEKIVEKLKALGAKVVLE